MKKIKKILLVLVLLVIVLFIATAAVSFIFLDNIVKTGVEKVAPTITKTTVTLDGVHISLLTGSASFKGLVVGNPEGYKSSSAISVGKATVSVVPGSIFGSKIVVHSIEVDAPEVTFEGNPFGANNLTKIKDNASSGAEAANKTAAQTPSGTKTQGAARKMEVDEFKITNVKVHALLTGVPGMEGKTLTLSIPNIELSQLGTGPDGITAAELTQQVLSQISEKSIEAIGSEVKNLGGSILKGATSGTNNIFNDGGKGLKKGLNGLFGK